MAHPMRGPGQCPQYCNGADELLYVVAAVDSAVQRSIKSSLTVPPASANTLDYLKHVLLATYALSDEQKADNILDVNSLSDLEPSGMLAHMHESAK